MGFWSLIFEHVVTNISSQCQRSLFDSFDLWPQSDTYCQNGINEQFPRQKIQIINEQLTVCLSVSKIRTKVY